MKTIGLLLGVVLALAACEGDPPPLLAPKPSAPPARVAAEVPPDHPERDPRADVRQAWVDDLAAREKAGGRTLEVIVGWLMLEAQGVFELARQRPGAPPVELDARIAACAPLVDELATYASAHPDQARAQGALPVAVEHARSFLAASRTVAAKLHANAEPLPGERQAVMLAFNALVSNLNRH